MVGLLEPALGFQDRLIRFTQRCDALRCMSTIKLYDVSKLMGMKFHAYSSCVVEIRLENFIIPPHVSCLQTQLFIYRIPDTNTHDLIEVIASRLC